MVIAVIYMLIIQQVDGNILYPRIVGGVMKVHPITILVLLLLSSNIYGVIWYDCCCSYLLDLKRNYQILGSPV